MTVKKSICHTVFFLLALVTLVPVASAQKYPEKNIRLVVAFPTGAPYVLALMIADRLREPLGQSIVPDFKSGAGGNVASEIVAKTPPDGYTLLLTSRRLPSAPACIRNSVMTPFAISYRSLYWRLFRTSWWCTLRYQRKA